MPVQWCKSLLLVAPGGTARELARLWQPLHLTGLWRGEWLGLRHGDWKRRALAALAAILKYRSQATVQISKAAVQPQPQNSHARMHLYNMASVAINSRWSVCMNIWCSSAGVPAAKSSEGLSYAEFALPRVLRGQEASQKEPSGSKNTSVLNQFLCSIIVPIIWIHMATKCYKDSTRSPSLWLAGGWSSTGAWWPVMTGKASVIAVAQRWTGDYGWDWRWKQMKGAIVWWFLVTECS